MSWCVNQQVVIQLMYHHCIHYLGGGILEKLKKLVKKLVPNAITLELKLFVSDQMPRRSRDMPFE